MDLLLFLHILGGATLVGALVTAVWFLLAARRTASFDGVRWAWRTLLYAALPSYLLMRVAGQLLADDLGLADADFAWITIGFIVGDVGALLLSAALIGTGVAVRMAGRSDGRAANPSSAGLSIAAGATSILIVAYLVALWAMTTKPV